MIPIAGFPNYQITKNGQIWTNKHKKFLRQYLTHNGYLFVRLWDKTKPGYRGSRISRLVLQTFVGPCPEGMECCHNDGIKTNNHLENLRWDTHRANIAEGNRAKGSKHGRAKLTEKDVRFIIYAVRTKEVSQRELAKIFRVGETNISDIIKKKNWKHSWKGKI